MPRFVTINPVPGTGFIDCFKWGDKILHEVLSRVSAEYKATSSPEGMGREEKCEKKKHLVPAWRRG